MQVIMGELPWWLEAKRRVGMYKSRHGLRLRDHDLVSNRDIVGLSDGQVQTLLGERAVAVWQSRWVASEKGRTTYSFIPDVTFASKTQWFNPSLRLNYILTGHGSMNGFLHRRGLEEDPGCACGVGEEDWEHVFQCMLYADLRDLNAMGIVDRDNGEYDVRGLLAREECYGREEEFAKAAFGRRDDAMRARLALA